MRQSENSFSDNDGYDLLFPLRERARNARGVCDPR